MKVIANRFITWLMGLTRLMRYFVIAVLFHVMLLAILGSIKIVAILPKIVAVFDAPTLPPAKEEEPDPFAAYRDFDYNGPTLGGGGGTGGKGAGGVPTAGATPEEVKAHIMTDQAKATTPSSVGDVIGVMSEAATAMARPAGGPEGIGPQVTGLGELKIGTAGIKGPGGGLLGARMGPQRTIALQKFHGSQQTEQAVVAALRWLKANQRTDGSWKCEQSDKAGTALAVLAFLGHGETPDSQEFGASVQKGIQSLVASVNNEGLVTGVSGNPQGYTQAIVTLALSEAYAMTQSPALRYPVERTINAIVRWQKANKTNPLNVGGWRYTPVSIDSDLSVSGWMIMALKSAKGAGITVPPETFDAALKYVWNMNGKKGFGYDKPDDWPNTTCIGVLCAQFLGQGKDRRVKQALDYLLDQKADWQKTKYPYVLYTWYYMTQAMFQGGGSYWAQWNGQIRDLMVKSQLEDGRWPVPNQSEWEMKTVSKSPVYSTSLGALILEVYYRYLPIYQLQESAAEEGATALPQVGPLPAQ